MNALNNHPLQLSEWLLICPTASVTEGIALCPVASCRFCLFSGGHSPEQAMWQATCHDSNVMLLTAGVQSCACDFQL